MTKMNRLYEHFQPENYNLNINLERLSRKFNGKVVIVGSLSKFDSPIKLHSKGLNITGAIVNDLPADTKPGKDDELIILPSSKLTDKNVSITLTFEGKITDSMHGLYPCYYEHEGKNKELLMTQFEPFYAHEVFPCIDEPEAKATFDLTLSSEDNVEVLSNMPVKSQSKDNDVLITSFETTPVMSCYLLAFVVGDLHKVSGKTKDNVDVNIWATPAQSSKSLNFSLDVAIRVIEYFSDYFDTPYPLPKSDHVAVPDFSAGAMENWGLITYREICLITDENAATSARQYVATVIAHEISHQWFGNLVTMRWWDDLWLNESFVNMMEYFVIDKIFPEWKIWNEFASHESLAALRRDSLPGVQPVKLAVNHPEEIGTLFDPSIVYAKGGNLLNMLRHYVGDRAFADGLKIYFDKHAYGNTSGSDLWEALGESSGLDIGSFMFEWLEKSGFPVLELTQNKKLSISQRHFIIGGESDDRLWPVPLLSNQATLPELLDKKSIELPAVDGLVLLNKDDSAYFITKYDDILQKRLLGNLSDLSDIDRLKLFNDAGLLSRGMLKPAADLIDLLIAFEQEEAQPVWSLISFTIADLRRFTSENKSDELHLKKLVGKISDPLLKKLGWNVKENESEATTKLRSTIIGLKIYSEDKNVINTAIKKYLASENDLAKIDGELRSSILIAAVRHSDDKSKVVENLIKQHNKTSSSELKSDISVALTSTKDIEVGKKLLVMFKDSSSIKPQDILFWFAYMIRNKHLREITWTWMVDNWSWIEKTYKDDHHYAVFPRYAANTFATKEYEDKFRQFFEPKVNEILLKRTIEIGYDEIAGRVKWIEANKDAVSKRLNSIK